VPEPNDFVKDLVPYVPGKPVEELEREQGISNAIKIASNENPLGPSPLALQAASDSLRSVYLYPDGDSFYLKNKLAKKLGVDTDCLIFGNGSNDVLDIIARTYMKEGDEAVMGEYAFIVYPIVTQGVGARAIISPMPDYTHNLKDMYSRITPKTKIVFIANPNNPTGTIVKREEMEWFLDKVHEDVIVVVDEAYFEYIYDPDYPDTLEYFGGGKSLITVRTFSKIYGLAGLRLGYGISSKEIISPMHRIRQPFNINSLAQSCGIAALDDGDHVERTRELNRFGLGFLSSQLTSLGVEFVPSYTNFVLIDLKSDPMPVYNSLLKEGIIVRPVLGYGLKTHLRVSVGLPHENEMFISALKKSLGN